MAVVVAGQPLGFPLACTGASNGDSGLSWSVYRFPGDTCEWLLVVVGDSRLSVYPQAPGNSAQIPMVIMDHGSPQVYT